MARLLITGGAGYVGSHAVKALAGLGHHCVVLDNFSRGHRDFVKWGPAVEGDVRDEALLAEVMTSHGIDAVLHFAALAYVGESVGDPGPYYEVNIGGTRSLLSAMSKVGIDKLVFSSTCAVYGSNLSAPICETTSCKPVNPYGFTKLACERMMDDFGFAHGLRSVRLRYFNAAGADPDGEIGERHDPETHLIPLVLGAALGTHPPVSVFGTTYPTLDGTAVRDYIHVTDLASAHARSLEYLLHGGSTLAVNLGTGSGHSVRQVIEAASQLLGRAVPFVEAPPRAGDPPELVAAAGLAQARLGWRAKHSSLESIISTALGWQTRTA